jgi:hypothetical protein
MQCRVIKMRIAGVTLEKGALKNQYETRGDLSIIDTRENGFNRILKLAKLVRGGADLSGYVETLYEPHILWINEDRFVLTGFERRQQDGKLVDYAQSWLCKVGIDPG